MTAIALGAGEELWPVGVVGIDAVGIVEEEFDAAE
jgi:hypothetical protein